MSIAIDDLICFSSFVFWIGCCSKIEDESTTTTHRATRLIKGSRVAGTCFVSRNRMEFLHTVRDMAFWDNFPSVYSTISPPSFFVCYFSGNNKVGAGRKKNSPPNFSISGSPERSIFSLDQEILEKQILCCSQLLCVMKCKLS